MPICSFAKRLPGATWPTISPSKRPSRDLTVRLGPNGLAPSAPAGCAAADPLEVAGTAVPAGACPAVDVVVVEVELAQPASAAKDTVRSAREVFTIEPS
jgi:hypothetical protein